MHRMNANRVSDHGTGSLVDDSIRRIESTVKKAQSKRALKRGGKNTQIKKKAKKEALQPTEEPQRRIVVSSIQEIPVNFERIGTGFYRCGHHLWEMSSSSDGIVLTRKRGEDHVLGYDPEPLERTASRDVVTDRHGAQLKVGDRVSFPLRGKVASGVVVVLQPGSLGVDVGMSSPVDVPADMVEHEEPMMMEEPAEDALHEESDVTSCEEFEPDVEPSSKMESDVVGDMSPEPDPELEPEEDLGDMDEFGRVRAADLKQWREYWASVGRRVADAPRKPMTEEQKRQRRDRRKEKKHEMAGLPKGTPAPPKPPKTASDDGDAKMKERLRMYEQLVDELKYILEDEKVRENEVMLADEVDRAITNFQEEYEQMDDSSKEEMDDKLDIEEPAQVEKEMGPKLPDMPKMSRIVVSMADLL